MLFDSVLIEHYIIQELITNSSFVCCSSLMNETFSSFSSWLRYVTFLIIYKCLLEFLADNDSTARHRRLIFTFTFGRLHF